MGRLLSSRGRSARASALRHPLPVAVMLVAPGDRAGRSPPSCDASCDQVRWRISPVVARSESTPISLFATPARSEPMLGCDLVLRQAEVERLGPSAGRGSTRSGRPYRPGAPCSRRRWCAARQGRSRHWRGSPGYGESSTDVVALALAQLGRLRLDLGELCGQTGGRGPRASWAFRARRCGQARSSKESAAGADAPQR